MSFRGVFIAIFVGTALIVSALMLNARRPQVETAQPTAALVRASGKCAECHRNATSAIVHEYELSRHSAQGINCYNCHQAIEGQKSLPHRGFVIAERVTAANCRQCHENEYQQYLRSRHAAPAWAAVTGKEGFTAEQVSFAERFHKGAVARPPHPLAGLEGKAATRVGCQRCHEVGRPNPDGSIGSCTACHARHAASVELARTPETCGQCHMGPDHSQIEIYHESKHGVLFNAQRALMNLKARPKQLSTSDMPVPTCATCHMSGLEGQKVSHDTTERLSYWLFQEVSDKRPTYAQGQVNMKETCQKCHTSGRIDQFYDEAEHVVGSTNELVGKSRDLIQQLRDEKLLTPEPFDEPIEFIAFDLWHYFGRTAKHGAFMGGADFVQWHGFYELIAKLTEMEHLAGELRKESKQDEPSRSDSDSRGASRSGLE